jgi:hypothetical protein
MLTINNTPLLQQLLNAADILPTVLVQWVPCAVTPSMPHLGREDVAFNGDISQTLTDALSDALAEATNSDDVYAQPEM